MAERGTFEYASQIVSQYIGQSVAKILGGNNVLFREVSTGRFSFSTDFWAYFRENYEEMKASGAFA